MSMQLLPMGAILSLQVLRNVVWHGRIGRFVLLYESG